MTHDPASSHRQAAVRPVPIRILIAARLLCVGLGSSPAWAVTSSFIVTVATDTTAGVASNCTGSPAPNCSLRDALAAAGATGSGGNITFDPTVFATPRTITLVNGGLNIPSQTTITGPTTGSGASPTNLVTVSGGGPVFTVNSGATNAVISGLTITGGITGNDGGGILNNGVLTVSNSTISGNIVSASFNGYLGPSGGGIENYGTLTLINSTISGNQVSFYTSGCPLGCGDSGGGIDNDGTLTLINSTVSGNSAVLFISYDGSITGPISASGGGINNYGTLTMNNSTVVGNSVNGYGIVINLGLTVGLGGGGIAGGAAGTNNIISGNTSNGSEDDCDGSSCPTSGQKGNLGGAGVQLAPFGSYGGPTQTSVPLPGSAAICAGVIADIPAGVTTDQRGFPRTTTYGSNPPCVDSGAVQTNYSLGFSTEPPSTSPATTNFTAAVQVSESGNAFPVSGISILTALAAGNNGTLNVSSISTNALGIASNNQLQISTPGSDHLAATLPLTASGVTPAAAASATSTEINVTQSSGVEVTVGASPAGLTFIVDGISYSAATTLVWPLGSQHTLSTTSPQGTAGTQYTFTSWSDGGAITHTVTASILTIDYTASFNTTYLLTTSANPSKGGTVSPASGYFPANSSVPLTATANPGYEFAGWTGNGVSGFSSTSIAMFAPETVTANFTTIPIYTVNTNVDDSTGTAANCSSGSKTLCSLRDALDAAGAATSGADIEFDPTVFAASQPATARTIVLGSAQTLNVPNNTRIFGPTTGSGHTFTQLVTINGKNLSYSPIFSTGNNTVLSGLVIADGPAGGIGNGGTLMVIDCTVSENIGTTSGNNGGGITNNGTLTVMGTAISGNSSNQGGGGILNEGSLTVLDSTISGNSASGTPFPVNTPSGGGIYNFQGTATIIDSTISGNSNTGIVAWGGAYQNASLQFVTIVNSTISGNTGGGVNVQAGIDVNSNNQIPVPLTVTDSVLSGNTTNGSEDDCDAYGTTCPTSGHDGNFVGPNALLAPLGNYGGPTSTQPPLAGSPAICAGVIADIPSGTSTDQRGLPRTTTYGSNPPCVDSGAVQTDYSLSFSTEPPPVVAPGVNFAAAVQLNESGNAFPVSGITIPLALGPGSAGTLSGNTTTTDSSGVATYSSLQVNATGSGDTLVATLALTASGATPAATASVTSTSFDVLEPAATPMISPSGGTYTSPQSVTITDTTSGAVIYYTIDGTTPTTSSTKYTGNITVSSTETIKAIAAATGYSDSAAATAAFAIESTIGSALQFIPVTACRVVDTRNANGSFGGPEMSAGQSRAFNIPQSACGIPSGAAAYSLNVTVVPSQALNYLTIWPTGQTQPYVSTLNSDGRIKANAAIVPAGTNGGVSVYVTDATQLILDIDGYFVASGTDSAALAFYPLAPCRIADTRNAAGSVGGPSINEGASRSFPILSSNCNVPTTARAYSLNITAVPHSTLNYLTTWPTGETQPYVSTLNASTGTVSANAAIVPAGTNGAVSVFVSDTSDVILDIIGYFAPPETGGLSLYAVSSCRVIDTRPEPFNSTKSINVAGSACAPPSTAQAYVLNATVIPAGPLDYLTLWPAEENQPNVSTLNSLDGAITSNMAIVPTNNGSIDVFPSDSTNLILDLSSYYAP